MQTYSSTATSRIEKEKGTTITTTYICKWIQFSTYCIRKAIASSSA